MKRLCIFLLICMAVCLTATISADAVEATGNCGTSLTWTLDDTGTLYISGSGAMQEFEYYNYTNAWGGLGSQITRIIIDEGVESIGEYAFYKLANLTCASIPQSVTSIGSAAFKQCSNLTSVMLPDGLTSISNNTFQNCSSLMSVTIPFSVTTIGSYAFDNCPLLDIYYNGTYTQWCAITILGWNSSLMTSVLRLIKNGSCGENLTWSLSDDNILTITGSGQISACTERDFPYAWNGYAGKIRGIVIDDGLTGIADSTFRNFTGLTSVTIPTSVTEIGNSAFEGCTSLTDVTYNGQKSQWNTVRIGSENQNLLGADMIFQSHIPHTIIVDPAVDPTCTNAGLTEGKHCSVCNEVLVVQEEIPAVGHTYNHGLCTTCYNVLDSICTVTLPGTLTIVCQEAFSGIDAERIIVPEGVTTIGTKAFADCVYLRVLVFLGDPSSIADDILTGCDDDLIIVAQRDSDILRWAVDHSFSVVSP